MLGKKHRLAVQSVLKKKTERQKRSRYFVLKIFKGQNKHSRSAVVVGQRVSKSAVERNKLKRLLYKGVKSLSLDQKEPRDYLLMVLPKSRELLVADGDVIVRELKKVYE